MKIFISFASEGIEFANKLNILLKSRGYITFLASENLNPGDYGWIEIGKELRDSHLIIFIITESSEESYGQRLEISLSTNLRKQIIPLVLEGIELSEFTILEGFNIVNFTAADVDTKFGLILSKLDEGVYSEEVEPVLSLPEDEKVERK